MHIPYFDAHCDTLTAVFENGGGLFENQYMVDFKRLSAYAPAAQVFAVWNGNYEAKAALLKRYCEQNSGLVELCRSVDEIERANAAGIIMLNLCWNSDNALCGAAMDSGSGLTEQGMEFVRECQRLGVAVDMSHASERTFWDTMELAE